MSSLFLDVTQRGLVLNNRRFDTARSETLLNMNKRRVTSQKSQDLIYSEAEA
jgi:hypothetical protein